MCQMPFWVWRTQLSPCSCANYVFGSTEVEQTRKQMSMTVLAGDKHYEDNGVAWEMEVAWRGGVAGVFHGAGSTLQQNCCHRSWNLSTVPWTLRLPGAYSARKMEVPLLLALSLTCCATLARSLAHLGSPSVSFHVHRRRWV